jgi:heterodisulfide reductase subunit A
LLLRTEDILHNRLLEKKVDMVVLAVGLEPREDAQQLGNLLGIACGEDGWFSEANQIIDPVNTFRGGISVAGVCQGPKDIPDTVAQASAAASRVLQSIINGAVKESVKDMPLPDIEARANQIATSMEGRS